MALKNIKKAIILAGGKGTRLSEYTSEIPKPMIKVGPYPIMIHIMRSSKEMELTHSIFVVAT